MFRLIITKRFSKRKSVRYRHKLSTSNTEKEESKVCSDVEKYIASFSEYQDIREKLPKSLFKKYKTPENMYLINSKTATQIVDTTKIYISPNDPVIEVNPGLGILSEKLLSSLPNSIYMYETASHFSHHLKGIQEQNPGRLTYKVGDFFGMWKLAFKDNIDNGNRIKELLGNLHTDDNSRSVKIFGSMPGLNFIKHLLNNLIFHSASNQLGRPDLFITMPGYNYEFLTDSQIQYGKHKSVAALFQIFFDYKILNKVPRVHFLPWTYPPTSKKALQMDDHNLYLVNITLKEKLPCPPEYLPLLWYFFKPHMLSKSTRVIPMLEQWIPGCGVWLITGQDPPDCNPRISPGEDDAKLPHMTIFTEFGDLTLAQKITIFKKFVSWPEFEQSPFKMTMENNLPKFVLNLDDDEKDRFGTHIDLESDTEIEH